MEVKIHKTKNYDKFHILGSNRSTRNPRLLKSAIKEINLMPFCPIIVDEDMNVIDGQHRLLACQSNDIEVCYVVIPKSYCDTDKAMVMLNKNQKTWSLMDYAHYWADKKGGCFKELLEFKERYNLRMSVACCVYSTYAKLGTKHLRGGIEFDKNPNADKIIEFVQSKEVSMLSFHNTKTFVYAIRNAFGIYNEKQLVKLRKNILKVPQSATSAQYQIVFQNIIM